MPIYEFHCKECSKNFESLILNNNEKIYCPYCKSKIITRLLSSFAYKTNGGKIISSSSSCTSCSGGSSCSSCS